MTGCPSCGHPLDAYAGGDPLLAACDVLVLRALELVGKRIVRVERSRYARMAGRPWHSAHLYWQPDEALVNKGLAEAWTHVRGVLDDHGCCGATPEQLTLVLDRYVRDLIAVMAGHDVRELRYRLGAYLGVPV